MKKLYAILFAAIPLFGAGIAGATISTVNETKAEDTTVRTFTGGRKQLTARYSSSPENETEYSTQKPYNFDAMNLGNTWDTIRGDNVTVAVIDSGANIYHEDFLKPEAQGMTISQNNVEQYSILNPKSCYIHDTGDGTSTATVETEVGILQCHDTDTYDSDYKEYYSHGTCTASCIGAMVNGVGGTGIAPNVDLLVIRCDLYDSSIDVAIRYAVDNGADVISMSFGAYDSTDCEEDDEYAYDGCATSMQSAIDYAYSKDVVCVASAGNESQGTHHSYPASNNHVIGVGALEKKSLTEISDFSCWNVVTGGVIDENNNADVFAPGYVWTAGVEDKKNTPNVYIETAGTSFSCPLTAGAIALYRSAYPNATVDEIKETLFNTCYDLGTTGRDATFGYGRVDVEKFLTSGDITSTTVSPSSATLTIDAAGNKQTQQLSVAFDPSDCDQCFKNGTWISSDEDIATVDQNGLVTPISSGTVSIGFIPGQGTRYSDAQITVIDNQIHAVESISLNKNEAQVGIGASTKLSVVWNPKNATNKNVTWSSSNSSIASVTNDGVVSGIAEGSAVITATSEDGNKTASCTVNVVDRQTAFIGFDGTEDGDSSSSLDENDLLDCLSNDSNSEIIDSFSNVSKVYQASDGLKLGNSSNPGKFTINLSQTINVKSMTLVTDQYGKDTGTIEVSVGSSSFGSVTPSDGETKLTGNASGSSITISTSKKRAYLMSISIEYTVGDSGSGGDDNVPVTGVSLNKTTASVNVGNTVQLSATISPSNASNKAMTWSSNDTSVATVSNNGLVSGLKSGTAVIIVTTADGNKTASCTVTVSENGGQITPISGSATIGFQGNGGTDDSWTYMPADEMLGNLTSNSDTDIIASFSDPMRIYQGVQGWKVGTSSGGTFTINFKQELKINSIEVNIHQYSNDETSLVLAIGEEEYGSIASTETSKTITKSASASSLTIKTESKRVYLDSLTINYGEGGNVDTVPVTGVTLNKGSTSLSVGGEEQLVATIAPSNATNKGINWSSNNNDVATVSSTGLVTAISEGTAIIMATSVDGNKVAICVVTVSNNGGTTEDVKVSSITTNANLSIQQGTFQFIQYTVGPENASNKAVIFTSSDESVVEVNANGRILAVKEGTATIIIAATDGSGVTATINVTVTKAGNNGNTSGSYNVASGCSGSVIASSAILSALSLVGAALLMVRRKKEK